ncbi:unnamed protein product, partial [Prunus brigantina]
MSRSGGSEVRTPIFSSENYEYWRIKMITIFKSYGLWTLVEKGITIPESKKKKTAKETSIEEDDEKMAAILMKDAKALGIIQNSISYQIFPHIANVDSAKMAWNLLYGEYHGGDHVRLVKLQNLRRESEYTRMHENESLSAYLTHLNDLINQMKTYVCSKFHFGECRYKGKPKCYNCDKFGHLARECTASKNVHKANCANQMEMTGNLFYAGEWYIDNGCSNHMTGNERLLTDIKTNVVGKVQMPNGELVNVAGMCTLAINTIKGRKYIKEVTYLPRLKENLLSVGQMDEHGYYLLFRGKLCSIFEGPSLECLVIKVEMKRNMCYPLALLPNDHIALKARVSNSTWT